MLKHLVYFGTLFALNSPSIALASPIGPVTEIVVSESRLGPSEASCGAFSLTDIEIRRFFEKAVLVSARQLHDYFLFGPCFIRGTVKTRYDTWQFEIRSMGTGSVTATNGDSFLLANPELESSLEGR